MAIARAPLFSLEARGRLDKALIYQQRKGQSVVKAYATPTYPGSAGQEQQRSYMEDSISAWQNYLTNTHIRDAWDRAAAQKPTPMSGYNLAVQALLNTFPILDPPSFVFYVGGADVGAVNFGWKNMDDGAEGDEAGWFQIFSGDSPGNMSFFETDLIEDGSMTTGQLGEVGDTVYVEVLKDRISRSGIVKWKLLV